MGIVDVSLLLKDVVVFIICQLVIVNDREWYRVRDDGVKVMFIEEMSYGDSIYEIKNMYLIMLLYILLLFFFLLIYEGCMRK